MTSTSSPTNAAPRRPGSAMYLPPHFTGDAELARLIIEHYPLAALVTEPFAVTHLPLVERTGRLIGHLARRNPQVEALADGARAVALFSGPHAYVSPRWYADPRDAVPTWDYCAVTATCRVVRREEPGAIRAILDALVQRFDPTWSSADIAPGAMEEMLGEIVGLELVVERIECKAKLSQNRGAEDRRRVLECSCASAPGRWTSPT